MTLFVAFHSACYLSGYYVYPDSASLWSELLEAIGSQTRQHSSLDVQAVSCYTEEKQSQEGEGDEKDDIHLSNWQFVKSHENIYVQVSDLIAGLLRKLFLFLDENPLTDIISIAMKLKDAQVKNFTLLWMLIRKSDEKSPLFIKNTNSQKNVQERMLKLQLLGVSNKESL